MTKYSRIKKYEDLRSKLQNDSESDIKSAALNSYVDRLTNSTKSVAHNQSTSNYGHDPIHQRRENSNSFVDDPQQFSKVSAESKDASFSMNTFKGYQPNVFQNDYLNEYLNEVKQYNIDQGNAFSENTEVDILRTIRGESKPAPIPNKPFVDEPEVDHFNTSRDLFETGTTKIPFFDNSVANVPDYSEFSKTTGTEQPTKKMTKTDIAAEVQSLIRDQSVQQQPTFDSTDSFSIPVSQHLEADRTTRQQLLNETTQMRAQLDDYEENLSDVSEKMQHTNTVLNIVLIVLIIALVAMLCVVIYWILSSRGIV